MKLFTTVSMLVLFAFSGLQAAEQVNITVKGMVCSFCAQGLIKKFKTEPAVKAVKVSLKDKNLALTLKDGHSLDDKHINQIINDAGYNVEKIKRSGDK